MKLKFLLDRYKPGEMADDIYRQLVSDLYGPIQSAVIGALTAALVGCFISWRTGNAALAAITVVIALVSVGRLLLALTFKRTRAGTGDAIKLRRWERLYFAGASAYTACLGALCFVALVATDDAVSHLLTTSLASGYIAAAAQRNAGRPLVALTQLLFVISPIVVGSILRFEPAYGVLALISLLYLVAMVEITAYHAEARLRLLATARELTQSNIHFDAAISNMSHGLCMLDEQQRLIVWNKRFCEINNIPEANLKRGSTIAEVVAQSIGAGNHPGRTTAEVAADYQAHLAGGEDAQTIRRLPNGRVIAMSHREMADGGIVAIFEDVTERERAAARVRHLSTHDDLTGLPNRMSFRLALREAATLGKRDGGSFALMFIDLDRFKIVNDTLGHAAGDDLLKQVSARLKGCLGTRDVLGRLGGDEFMALLPATTDREEVAATARKLLAAAIMPVVIQGQECHVTASIGISMFPADATDDEALIRSADMAMYAAKEQGRNSYCFHSMEMGTKSLERIVLELKHTAARLKGRSDAIGAREEARKTAS